MEVFKRSNDHFPSQIKGLIGETRVTQAQFLWGEFSELQQQLSSLKNWEMGPFYFDVALGKVTERSKTASAFGRWYRGEFSVQSQCIKRVYL
jgi:hypothetical protein